MLDPEIASGGELSTLGVTHLAGVCDAVLPVCNLEPIVGRDPALRRGSEVVASGVDLLLLEQRGERFGRLSRVGVERMSDGVDRRG